MKNFMLAAFAALVTALVTVACGGGPRDLCADRQVRCDEPLACDPEDGVCKCGGRGGMVCDAASVCDANSNTCLSTRCAGVNCQGGTSCDVMDGTCKCGGTGGQVCGQGEVCNAAAKTCEQPASCTEIACAANETCDPGTGTCECGDASCDQGQACSVSQDQSKTCVPDNCFGVTCVGGTTCDPADGRCKCNGVTCAPGSVCGCAADAGTCTAEQRSCRESSSCANVVCGGGTTCDPLDGKCKCGGPGGPACGADQVCDLATTTCQGGNQCGLADGGTKVCPSGTSCDPEDGQCKCGGRGGTVCTDDETCVQTAFSQTCRPKCDPRLQDCAPGTYCYFDTLAKTPTAYCAVPSDTKDQGQGCSNPTACFTTTPTSKGLFCNGLGTFEQPGGSGFCRLYCDTTTGNQSCPQALPNVGPMNCVTVPGAAPGVGYCQPLQ